MLKIENIKNILDFDIDEQIIQKLEHLDKTQKNPYLEVYADLERLRNESKLIKTNLANV